MKRVAIALVVALLATQAAVLIVRADRQPEIDEVEYLHAAWLMANGERLFVTFFEHHSPLLFAPLVPLAPHAERVEAQPYVERARMLAGLAGLIALAAFAAVVARGNPIAPVIALAAFFGSGAVWLRVIADVRAEPFALALFWCGAALVLLPKQRIEIAAGFGLGLIALAGLWTPKWPLCSAVIGICALMRVRRGRGVMIAIAFAMAATGVVAIAAMAPLDVVRFFVFDFSAAVYRLLQRVSPPALLERPFYYAPLVFATPNVIAAATIVAFGAVVDRERRPSLLFIVLFVVSLIEIRFLHSYPAVWIHNYGLWSLSAAAIYGCVPGAIVSLLSRANVSARFRNAIHIGVPAAAVLLVLPNVWTQVSFASNDTGVYWRTQRALVARMQPHDTVFIPLTRHPITVRDAHYYWFGRESGVYDTIAELRQTARGARYLRPLQNLPLCTALRGQNQLRFAPRPSNFPDAESEVACFDRLQAAGRIRRTPAPAIFEILPRRTQ